MAGYTSAYEKTILDAQHLASTSQFVAWSINGTSETSIMARTAITAYSPASGGSPSIKANANALTTAAATGSGTITHFAVWSASSGGTQITDWHALASSRTVTTGDTLTIAVGAIQITLD